MADFALHSESNRSVLRLFMAFDSSDSFSRWRSAWRVRRLPVWTRGRVGDYVLGIPCFAVHRAMKPESGPPSPSFITHLQPSPQVIVLHPGSYSSRGFAFGMRRHPGTVELNTLVMVSWDVML